MLSVTPTHIATLHISIAQVSRTIVDIHIGRTREVALPIVIVASFPYTFMI